MTGDFPRDSLPFITTAGGGTYSSISSVMLSTYKIRNNVKKMDPFRIFRKIYHQDCLYCTTVVAMVAFRPSELSETCCQSQAFRQVHPGKLLEFPSIGTSGALLRHL